MRKVAVQNLVSGMKVGQPVLGPHMEPYLQAGVVLNDRIISRLVILGIPSVVIDDGFLNDTDIPSAVSVETRAEAANRVRELFDAPDYDRPVPTAPLGATVNNIIDEILSNASGTSSALNIMDIRAEDEYLYYHSVNVCVLSVLTGITLGYKRRKLFELGMGALFHDIGKRRIPSSILNKPGPLTKEEYAIVKQHTVFAKELLADNPSAAEIAYSHHERCNGEGYPLGLKAPHISPMAQIAGMADIFDALTADRVYRKGVPAHQAFEMLAAAGDYWFDYDLLLAFLYNIPAYPSGSIVELSCGEIGVVIGTPKGHSAFPEVKIILDPDKKRRQKPVILSTLKHNIAVLRLLEQEEIGRLGLMP
ncbi:MAG: HD-GYP domain-containing protein [Bacillota bacterium]